jgi:hypothetical protein
LQGRDAGPVDFEITSSPGTDLNDIVTITDAIQSYKEEGSLILLRLSEVQTPTSSAETSSFSFELFEVIDG